MTSEERPDPFYEDAARKAGGSSWLGFGRGQGHSFGAMDDAFAYQGDTSGFRQSARDHGWTGAAEQPPVVAEIVQCAPVPTGSEYTVTDVVTGMFQGWDAIALNVGMRSAGVVPKWAMTAVGRAEPGGAYRLHPRRLGRFHLLGEERSEIDLSSSALDARWSLTVSIGANAGDESIVDPAVERALLSSDDGDELWATSTAIAAVRADGHRPALLEHHLRLLATLAQADARLSSR